MPTTTATAVTVTAGATAIAIGIDPIPWVIGSAGATVIYAYRPPDTRAKVLANTVVCIFLGGVVAPWASPLVATYFGAAWSNQYVLAGALSVAWPWAGPVVWARLVQLIAVFTPTSGQPPKS